MVKFIGNYIISLKNSSFFLTLGLVMVFWLSLVNTNAQAPVTVMKTDAANQYEELHLYAEKGILYTLQNSQDLANWNHDLTFIGNGQLVKLRLFALNNNVLPQNGNDAPYTTVSGSIRKVSTGGTYVSWVSLEDQSIKHAFFPTVELESHFPSSYSGLKNGYYLFLYHEIPTVVIDSDSPVTGQDLAFKNALPYLISGINSDTITGVSPRRPHRPFSNLSKQFWRINTDPEIDSDGDGVTDIDESIIGTDSFDEDTDNNGVSDEIIPLTYEDSDSDGLTDSEEEALGSDPNNADTDGDKLIDGNDADPLDAAVAWLRTSESSYVVTELDLPAGFDLSTDTANFRIINIDLGESNHVLLSIADESASNKPDPTKGVPDKNAYKSAVWQPSTGTWVDLTMPDNIRATAYMIDPVGNVYGDGIIALGADKSRPGVKRVRARWKKLGENLGWQEAHTEFGIEGGASFSNEIDTYKHASASHVYYGLDDALFGQSGRFVGFSSQNDDENDLGYIQRVEKESNIATPFASSHYYSNDSVEYVMTVGDPSGWHAALWKMHNNSDMDPPIFSKLIEAEDGQTSGSLLNAKPPTGDSLRTLIGIASIDPGYLPEGVSELIIWANEKDGFLSAKVANNGYSNLEWKASDKSDKTQSLNPPSPYYSPDSFGSTPGGFTSYGPPKINSRGEALKDNKLWRNGKWHELADLIPSLAESDFQALDLNNEGSILIQQEGKLKVAKVAYQPKWWGGTVPFSQGAVDTHPLDRSLADITPHTKEYQAFALRALDFQYTVLTVDGGAIDIGHVRHNMDRTLSFYYQLCKKFRKVGVIKRATEFKSNINDEDYYADALRMDKKIKPAYAIGDLTRKNVVEAAYDMAMLEARFYEDSSIEKIDKGNGKQLNEPPAATRAHDDSFWTIDDRPSDHLGALIAKEYLESKPFDYAPTPEEWAKEMDERLIKKLKRLKPLTKEQCNQWRQSEAGKKFAEKAKTQIYKSIRPELLTGASQFYQE